mgnify:CR=1
MAFLKLFVSLKVVTNFQYTQRHTYTKLQI